MLYENMQPIKSIKKIEKAIRAFGYRTISYLQLFPASILMGYQSFFKIIDECKTFIAAKNIHQIIQIYQQPVIHAISIRVYLQHRAQTHHHNCQFRTERQKSATQKYNKGVRLTTFQTKNFVILHQKRRGKFDPN